jgi:putative ABC transport system permease protein
LSYDRYHKESKNIYRVITHFKDASNEFTWPGAEMPLAEALRNNYPQVKNAASFRSTPEEFYQCGDKHFWLKNLKIHIVNTRNGDQKKSDDFKSV